MKKDKEMTKYQKYIFNLLKKGKKIDSFIIGWFFNHRLLSIETEDALWKTGELIEVIIKGKYMHKRYIYHYTQLKKIINNRDVIMYKLRNKWIRNE